MAEKMLLRNIIEIGFGMLYLIGAIFNSLYTLHHGDEFYGSFPEKAILAPAKGLVQEVVIPHARVFTVLLIIFQVTVAICILSRGRSSSQDLWLERSFAWGLYSHQILAEQLPIWLWLFFSFISVIPIMVKLLQNFIHGRW